MSWIFIVFFIYFLTFEPVFGRLMFKGFLRRLASDPGEKLRYYRKALICSWLPAGIIALLVFTGNVGVEDLGIAWIRISGDRLGVWPAYGVLLLYGIFVLLYLYQIIMARISEPYRARLASVKVPEEAGKMLPGTEMEKRYWFFISTTAGLVEELIYRGFLLFLLGRLFPGIPFLVCILVSAVLFGLAHSYQGPAGVLKTGIAGLFFMLVYVSTGSLLPGILLHFLMDYSAKDIGKGNGEQESIPA